MPRHARGVRGIAGNKNVYRRTITDWKAARPTKAVRARHRGAHLQGPRRAKPRDRLREAHRSALRYARHPHPPKGPHQWIALQPNRRPRRASPPLDSFAAREVPLRRVPTKGLHRGTVTLPFTDIEGSTVLLKHRRSGARGHPYHWSKASRRRSHGSPSESTHRRSDAFSLSAGSRASSASMLRP